MQVRVIDACVIFKLKNNLYFVNITIACLTILDFVSTIHVISNLKEYVVITGNNVF